MKQAGFYRPRGAWVGDLIPWQQDGVFHLFYLHKIRGIPEEGVPWKRVVTEDLLTFTESGEAISSAHPDAIDFNIYTGSIVLDEQGTHHAFYTGHNPEIVGEDGVALQTVMHAISQDNMATWQRQPQNSFGATAGYETGDWRDPFVFYDEEAKIWRMLITARRDSGPLRRRGVIAQQTSTDLQSWEPAPTFWDPKRYVALECPEVFAWGDWWYLVYSEFSDKFTTRYRMSRSVNGPWIVPSHDSIDGRAFYAAKSAARDGRRLFFGWIPSREDSHDDGAWQWAGTLSVLEATQLEDGTLAFHPTPELRQTFGGVLENLAPGTVLSAPDSYQLALTQPVTASSFCVRAQFDVTNQTKEFGVLLKASADGDQAYFLRLEPQRNRLVFDRWPRKTTGSHQWEISGDVPFSVELERDCVLDAGVHDLEVIVDGDICIATVNNSTVLSTRIYNLPAGRVGAFVGEGEIGIKKFEVLARTETQA